MPKPAEDEVTPIRAQSDVMGGSKPSLARSKGKKKAA